MVALKHDLQAGLEDIFDNAPKLFLMGHGHGGVSAPTIYAKFKSKRGILLAIIDAALPSEEHDRLVISVSKESLVTDKLKIAAKLSRQLYDAEFQKMECLRGAVMIDPIFKQLEQEREDRRYRRQSKTVSLMAKEGMFAKNLSHAKARDILWAFTGRDFYRMLVIKRDWPSSMLMPQVT